MMFLDILKSSSPFYAINQIYLNK